LHIQSEMCNKLFDANHVSLLFEKYNSIKTLIYPTFSVKLHNNVNFKATHFVALSKQIQFK